MLRPTPFPAMFVSTTMRACSGRVKRNLAAVENWWIDLAAARRMAALTTGLPDQSFVHRPRTHLHRWSTVRAVIVQGDVTMRITSSVLFVLGAIPALIGLTVIGFGRDVGDGFLLVFVSIFLLGPAVGFRLASNRQEEANRIIASALHDHERGNVSVSRIASRFNLPVTRVVEVINQAKSRGWLPEDVKVKYSVETAETKKPTL